MYGIKQVHRMHVRLATGPGGLKPTWILAPVAVRFSGRYRICSECVCWTLAVLGGSIYLWWNLPTITAIMLASGCHVDYAK